ncbi:MAG: Gfo/Idh/MocA family oxidoreductase [Candidatus Marinimicrobia bacterium]|nr:Gfo/Idh/MocA family oxidoreductase [Candidatus Neomarinimicrobiota bacterium]
MKKDTKTINRRDFIKKSTAAAAAFTIVPRYVLGGPGFTAPSDKLNIACVGVGGKGYSDTHGVASENIVALCDVDELKAAKTFNDFPNAKRYTDFRVMLEKEKGIDAVTVTTPDHNHAVVAMAAMDLGKHVYVQKPLTHTVHEARMLAKKAKEMNVITQMGNQGHAGEGGRLINEWIWDGAIGDVTEVHVWTNRPVWPQGIGRPGTLPSVPETLDWNQWLGPAKWRPYHPAYVPFAWRGWWDYGTGALGDMGAHLIDHPYWALKMEYPDTVQASSSSINDETYPHASMVTYEFPAREGMVPVKMVWYDGGLMPPRPKELEPGRKMGDGGGGVLFYGTKGKMMCSTYGNNPRIIPETAMKEYQRPKKSIPRSPGIREEWIEAIKGGSPTTSHFEYASKLTETMLLGCIALRVKDNNMALEWDGKKGQFTNYDEANAFIHKEYRDGWTL